MKRKKNDQGYLYYTQHVKKAVSHAFFLKTVTLTTCAAAYVCKGQNTRLNAGGRKEREGLYGS